MPAVVIAGTHSGCGKTTITLAMLAALRKKGMAVQSFKVGPDFIDTGLHRLITGRPSRNLDLWMCGEDYVKACFYKHSANVDISIIEGVMGMYDGDFSTAKLADVLKVPVILVVDAYGMAESAGAVVKGFISYKSQRAKGSEGHSRKNSDTNIAGVIFNRVASERHFRRLKDSVHDIPVFGYLPRDLNFEIPHRHLGLTVAEENPISEEVNERLGMAVLEYVDIEGILNKSILDNPKPGASSEEGKAQVFVLSQYQGYSPVIAIAYDKAFCFYYEDNLDLLRDAGAKIVTFSPLSDAALPENIDAIYIGGGYPELYVRELSKNQSMVEAIYRWAHSGKPMYAECGGLMYLSKGIHDSGGNFFKMAGVFPFETVMKGDRFTLGYREIQLNEDCLMGRKGDRLRGHEFHYSEIKLPGNLHETGSRPTNTCAFPSCYYLFDNTRRSLKNEGYRFKNTLASYVHIHFGSNRDIAKSFINFIKECPWKT